jgi:putative methionine-R-sulfoxide reductase with GAF domain
VTDAALSYLGADDLLAELLARVKEILDADMVAVLLLDSSGRQLIATAASGLEEEVRQGVRIPVGQGFAGRIAAGRRPVILDHVDHGNVLNPILLDKGIQSLVGVPLLVHGAVIGVLHVGTVRNRVFTADDATLLQLAADRAALAVQSLRSREDRAAAAALQRSLLPSALPVVTGVEAGASWAWWSVPPSVGQQRGLREARDAFGDFQRARHVFASCHHLHRQPAAGRGEGVVLAGCGPSRGPEARHGRPARWPGPRRAGGRAARWSGRPAWSSWCPPWCLVPGSVVGRPTTVTRTDSRPGPNSSD